ncbi:CAP domain-containing protein [Candidatus Saccharibacteria bacterium]|jgi:uncharacterized protein YkwD|nr:CAP domain-containing protein [Candidatus Saccharibacteria bacterium]
MRISIAIVITLLATTLLGYVYISNATDILNYESQNKQHLDDRYRHLKNTYKKEHPEDYNSTRKDILKEDYIDDYRKSRKDILKREQVAKFKKAPPNPQELLELINAERANSGLNPLTIDEDLQASAQSSADHYNLTSNDPKRRNGYVSITSTGGCVYYSSDHQIGYLTSRSLFTRLKNSSSARSNMTSPEAKSLAVGVSQRERDNLSYIVLLFCKKYRQKAI